MSHPKSDALDVKHLTLFIDFSHIYDIIILSQGE